MVELPSSYSIAHIPVRVYADANVQLLHVPPPVQDPRRPAARAASGGPLAWGPHSRTACSPPSRSCAASTTHSMSNCPRPDSLRGQDYAQRRNYEHPRVVYREAGRHDVQAHARVPSHVLRLDRRFPDGVDPWSVRVLGAGRHYGSDRPSATSDIPLIDVPSLKAAK
ncbi:hypothetical protein HBI73_214610 [Parastagonospora nodorum]|nr:hypothetical protein HBH63_231130 [Parastagonospora nodorum]KAH5057731.1 hypothetical protein HBI73_214610 [Parastagonospora nodorum]KAH5139232.1 hypothetical protein HBH69_219960 [Parastagonospora nodorum]KAH5240488.1 hypothetical protein HBI71_217290 [Parastagonospora nodorum]KAH5296677.1 hypothetical protein HBI12_212540 [Parastagonospora nodorum]